MHLGLTLDWRHDSSLDQVSSLLQTESASRLLRQRCPCSHFYLSPLACQSTQHVVLVTKVCGMKHTASASLKCVPSPALTVNCCVGR